MLGQCSEPSRELKGTKPFLLGVNLLGGLLGRVVQGSRTKTVRVLNHYKHYPTVLFRLGCGGGQVVSRVASGTESSWVLYV